MKGTDTGQGERHGEKKYVNVLCQVVREYEYGSLETVPGLPSSPSIFNSRHSVCFRLLQPLPIPSAPPVSCIFATQIPELLVCSFFPLNFRTVIMRVIGSVLVGLSCLPVMLSFKSVGAFSSQARKTGNKNFAIIECLCSW